MLLSSSRCQSNLGEREGEEGGGVLSYLLFYHLFSFFFFFFFSFFSFTFPIIIITVCAFFSGDARGGDLGRHVCMRVGGIFCQTKKKQKNKKQKTKQNKAHTQ